MEFFKLADADPRFQEFIRNRTPVELVLLSKETVHTPSLNSRPFAMPAPTQPAPAVPRGSPSVASLLSASPPVPCMLSTTPPSSSRWSPKSAKKGKEKKHELLSVASPELRRKKNKDASPMSRQDAFKRAKSSMVGRSGGSGRFKSLFKATSSISQPNCSSDIIVRPPAPETPPRPSSSDKGTTFEPIPLEALGYTWADVSPPPPPALCLSAFFTRRHCAHTSTPATLVPLLCTIAARRWATTDTSRHLSGPSLRQTSLGSTLRWETRPWITSASAESTSCWRYPSRSICTTCIS